MDAFAQANWHELPAEQATGLLESILATGLELTEVAERLRRFGPNQMTAQRWLSERVRFLLPFYQPICVCCTSAIWKLRKPR